MFKKMFVCMSWKLPGAFCQNILSMNILATVSEGCHFGFRGVWRWDKAGTSCFWDTQFMASLPKFLSTQVRKINIFLKGFPSKFPYKSDGCQDHHHWSHCQCGLFTFAFATRGAIHISNHNRGRALELLAQLVPILMEKTPVNCNIPELIQPKKKTI